MHSCLSFPATSFMPCLSYMTCNDHERIRRPNKGRTKRVQATARMASVVSSTPPARRRLIRIVRRHYAPRQSKQDMEQTPNDNKSQRSPALAYAIGLPLGAAIGVALWLTTRNLAIGIGVGVALGIAFAIVFSRAKK